MHKSNSTWWRWLVVILIVFVVVVMLAVPALAREKQTTLANWTPSVVDPLEGGSSVSITIDKNNRPHISYLGFESAEVDARYGLKYARWDGAKWVITFLDQTGKTEDVETSIALDSQGNPHISYYEGGGHHLKYAYYDSDSQSWIKEIVGEDVDAGVTNSLRLDNNDLPRIAYWDNNQDRVRYASFDGTKWNFLTVETLTCASPLPQRVSLVLDTKDQPHVSYHDCALPTKLKYALQVSGTWTPEVVEEGNNSGLCSSIEVDDQNRPHISYRSGNTAGGLMYANFNGIEWLYSPRIDNDFLWGKSTSLELNAQDRPRIAYTFWPTDDPEFTKEFRFAYLTGGQRTVETIDSADPASMKAQIDLAIDGEGDYHVAYWDDTTNQLKYAKRVPLNEGLSIFLPVLIKE